MGCVASRSIDKEERVQRCKERKRLMKKLLLLRTHFASAHLSYLQALKNTGVTLRQFTDSESLQEEDLLLQPCSPPPLPPLPPPPPPPPLVVLPPPPPPPPPFSEGEEEEEGNCSGGSSISSSPSSTSTPPPPPLTSSSTWDFWDPFGAPSSASACSSPLRLKKAEKAIARSVRVEVAKEEEEEEHFVETNTEFEEEKEDGEMGAKEKEKEKEKEEMIVTDIVLSESPFYVKPNPLLPPPLVEEHRDDNGNCSSMGSSSYLNLSTQNGGRIIKKKKKKSLSALVREIDDYFLKASDSGRAIALILDINRNDSFGGESSMRKSFKSAKVFNALSWSRSSKSLHSSKDAVEFYESSDPCKPGAHCITLDKIYAEEEKLYKEVKEEENTKLECERKTLLLQKQETSDQDLLKTEEIRTSIESLQAEICCLQQSISKTSSTIIKLIDEELYPQVIELSSRLMHMWRTMHECHQVQNHIAQQLNHLTDHPSLEPTSDYHRQSTAQLETEVKAWSISFCNLLQSQCEYIRVLHRWVQLTDCLLDDRQQKDCLSGVQTLCEEWKLALDQLPDKVVSEAIKSFISVIHSIVLQQTEERNLQKKLDRFEKKLQKELNTLSEMEKKFEGNLTGEVTSSLSPNHPLAVKRAKTEAFKKRVEDEKAKYLNSVQVSRAMTLNNLQTSLPNIFQALTGFSGACAQAFGAVNSYNRSTVCPNVSNSCPNES